MKAPGQDELWEMVAGAREGVLATIGADGLPHLSNVYYITEPPEGAADGARIIRVSTTTTRAKGRNLLRDPRAVLHVAGADFFNYAVAEGTVTLDEAKTPGDRATDELYAVDRVFNGEQERPAFDAKMIRDRRVIVRIDVAKLYGLVFRGR
ncbi:PPOX class F420-dependent oxidoreductase [Yinghuangia sp. ASG 101]|uniref:PPOX class F420-dependent oxidoreductase n=1 Tax=Yinghuangia sp. ASG 101 TaxID=2896848 RepID=UPI001E408C66|nr:PPOX class F420-dependent oxidoreductase [Yinghuangia sp. ASG 101]UGQ12813.1 PPOX class F420-dependent oxidoreductase [Yinghuangia sp. ASG 101]